MPNEATKNSVKSEPLKFIRHYDLDAMHFLWCNHPELVEYIKRLEPVEIFGYCTYRYNEKLEMAMKKANIPFNVFHVEVKWIPIK